MTPSGSRASAQHLRCESADHWRKSLVRRIELVLGPTYVYTTELSARR
jgi:hypothetical protein